MQRHLNLVLKRQEYVNEFNNTVSLGQFISLTLQSVYMPLETAEVLPGVEALLGGIHLCRVQRDEISRVQLCVCVCVFWLLWRSDMSSFHVTRRHSKALDEGPGLF